MVDVFVTYRGYSEKMDNQIEELAKRHGGRHLGGGYGFTTNVRDAQVRFQSARSAANFKKAVKRDLKRALVTD